MEDNFSEFKLFYEMNRDKFPADLKGPLENFTEFATFYLQVYQPCEKRLAPKLRKLMFKHYPALAEATHPSQLQYIEDINGTAAYGLMFPLRRILKEQAEGMVVREKYPKIDSWREFYGKPEQPDKM